MKEGLKEEVLYSSYSFVCSTEYCRVYTSLAFWKGQEVIVLFLLSSVTEYSQAILLSVCFRVPTYVYIRVMTLT